jgi:hypothetical protein
MTSLHGPRRPPALGSHSRAVEGRTLGRVTSRPTIAQRRVNKVVLRCHRGCPGACRTLTEQRSFVERGRRSLAFCGRTDARRFPARGLGIHRPSEHPRSRQPGPGKHTCSPRHRAGPCEARRSPRRAHTPASADCRPISLRPVGFQGERPVRTAGACLTPRAGNT